MTDAAELRVVVSHTDKGVQAFLAKLQEQLVRTDQAANRTGSTMQGSLSAGQARAALTAAKVATQEQRTATELQRTAAAASRAEAATLRLAQSKERVAQASTNASTAGRGLTTVWQGLTTAAGTFGVALTAGAIVQGTINIAQTGAQAGLTRQRFDQLAQAAGTTGDALIGALREASGSEISDLNLELAANRAQMLGVAKNADEFAQLMAIARDRAQSLGQTTSSAFNDIVVGLGRGSPEILDNLAIMVSAEEAYQKYAQSVGKATSELTKADQKQAIINEALRQGAISLAQTGGAIDSSVGKFARLTTAWENAANAIGAAIAKAYNPDVDIQVLNSLANLFPDDATVQAQATAQAVGEAVRTIAAEYEQLKLAGADSATAFGALVPQLQAVAATSAENAATISTLVEGYAHGTVTIDELRTALANLQAQHQATAIATQQDAAEAIALARANQEATTSANAHTSALEDEAARSLLSAAHTEQLSIAKAVLEQQARAAAAALIDAGDAGAAKAAQLAQSSSQVDQLTAAYYQLGAQAQQAAQLAISAARTASKIVPGLGGMLPGLGTVLNGLAQAKSTGRPQDIGLKPVSVPKATGGRGAGGGRSPKVRAAEKETQQLLNAQEQYNKDSAELERDHQTKLAEIAEQGAKKRAEAEKKFKQTSLDSRSSFYDSLESIEDHGVQQQLAAKYEAAVQEANRIAQESGADAAEAYLNAAQDKIASEAELEQQIREAEEKGDAARVEFLKGRLALRQQANDNELNDIRTHGSDIAAEQAQQYAAEEQAYAEHLDRMMATYDEKVGKVVGTQPGVAPSTPSGRPPRPPASSGTASSPSTPQTTTSANDGWQAILDRLNAVETAVRDVRSGVDKTTSAVQNLAQRGVKQ